MTIFLQTLLHSIILIIENIEIALFEFKHYDRSIPNCRYLSHHHTYCIYLTLLLVFLAPKIIL